MSMNLSYKLKANTHATNNPLHNSSALAKAYNCLHVPPKPINSLASKISKICINNSSGSLLRFPVFSLELIDEVYAFPEGFTPRGCGGIASAGIESSSGGREAHLMRFVGRSSESEVLDKRTPGAIALSVVVMIA
jgi:hypothetical protein